MIILSPLLGSLMATILMLIYGSIESSINIQNVVDLISIFPITFLIISIISYLFSIPIGLILIKENNKRLWSDGFFIFLCSVVGSVLGLVFSIISFNIGGGILKTVFIFTSFFLAATFNGSFYITLNREANKLNNKKI
jgi:hypothetical protein